MENHTAERMPESSDTDLGRNRIALEAGKRLRHAVDLAGGPSHISRLAAINLRSLNNYLRGHEMRRDVLVALADACGVSVEWLAAGRGDMPTTPQKDRLKTEAYQQVPGVDHLIPTPDYQALLRDHPELAPRHYATRQEAEQAVAEAALQEAPKENKRDANVKNDSHASKNPGRLPREETENTKSNPSPGDQAMLAAAEMTKDLLSQAVRLVTRFYGKDFANIDPDTVAQKIAEAYDVLTGKKP